MANVVTSVSEKVEYYNKKGMKIIASVNGSRVSIIVNADYKEETPLVPGPRDAESILAQFSRGDKMSVVCLGGHSIKVVDQILFVDDKQVDGIWNSNEM